MCNSPIKHQWIGLQQLILSVGNKQWVWFEPMQCGPVGTSVFIVLIIFLIKPNIAHRQQFARLCPDSDTPVKVKRLLLSCSNLTFSVTWWASERLSSITEAGQMIAFSVNIMLLVWVWWYYDSYSCDTGNPSDGSGLLFISMLKPASVKNHSAHLSSKWEYIIHFE